MSLENAIQNLADAITAQTAALVNGPRIIAESVAEIEPKAAKPAKPAKPEAKPVKPEAKPAAKPAKAAKPEPEPSDEEEEDGGFGNEEGDKTAVSLDDVKVVLGRYAAKEGKPAAMKILENYGVQNVNKLDAGDWGPLVEEVESLLEE